MLSKIVDFGNLFKILLAIIKPDLASPILTPLIQISFPLGLFLLSKKKNFSLILFRFSLDNESLIKKNKSTKKEKKFENCLYIIKAIYFERFSDNFVTLFSSSLTNSRLLSKFLLGSYLIGFPQTATNLLNGNTKRKLSHDFNLILNLAE